MLILVLLAIGFVVGHASIGEGLSWAKLARHEEHLLGLVAAHPILSPFIYLLFYTIWVALSIPEAAVITLVGGLLFGTLLGGAMAVLGSTAGAVMLFLIARSALGETMRRRAGAFLERIRPRLHRDGFNDMLALRLFPTPFWLVNLAAGVSGMRLLPFAAATLIGVIPATFVMAWIGAGAAGVLADGRAPDMRVLIVPSRAGPACSLGRSLPPAGRLALPSEAITV